MVKKFNEFVSEGVMTNTLKRFHTGEQRKEDKTYSEWDKWIKSVNWVDMGGDVLWSETNLPMEHIDSETFVDLLEDKSSKLFKFLEDNNIRIPTTRDFSNLCLVNSKVSRKDIDENGKKIYKIISKSTNNYLRMCNGGSNWIVVERRLDNNLIVKRNNSMTYISIFDWVSKKPLNTFDFRLQHMNTHTHELIKIKLVKDK